MVRANLRLPCRALW